MDTTLCSNGINEDSEKERGKRGMKGKFSNTILWVDSGYPYKILDLKARRVRKEVGCKVKFVTEEEFTDLVLHPGKLPPSVIIYTTSLRWECNESIGSHIDSLRLAGHYVIVYSTFSPHMNTSKKYDAYVTMARYDPRPVYDRVRSKSMDALCDAIALAFTK